MAKTIKISVEDLRGTRDQLRELLAGIDGLLDGAGASAESRKGKGSSLGPGGKGAKGKPSGRTPMGTAKPASEGDVSEVSYSAEKLEQMNRRELSAAAKGMKLDVTGKRAPAIRKAILDAQGGGGKDTTVKGTCDITGDEGVPVKEMKHDGEKLNIGPRVVAAIEEGAELGDLVEGEDEVENYE